MKIDKTPPLPRLNAGESSRAPEPSAARSAGAGDAANPAVVTHLNNAMGDHSQDVNAARVAEIKEAIREGRLEIEPERIAEGLIASARDLLQDDH